jgi:hypothetical protein
MAELWPCRANFGVILGVYSLALSRVVYMDCIYSVLLELEVP